MKQLKIESTGFPLTNDTLRFLNSSTLEVMTALAKVCGDKTILSGVVETAGFISDGLIAVNGEVLFFQSCPMQPNVQITEVVQNVNYNTDPQDSSAVASFPAYAVKTATCVESEASFPFSDLVRLKELKALSANSLQVLQRITLDIGEVNVAGISEDVVFPVPVVGDYNVMMHWKSELTLGEEVGFNTGMAWETRNETANGFTLRARRLGSASTSNANTYKVDIILISK